MTAGDQHVELAGLHIDLVDVRTGHVQRAVITALHDGQLARCGEAAHRFGVQAGVGGIDIQPWRLHFITVVEHPRRIGDGVQLLAVVADGKGEHRARLLPRLLGDAGVEHLLAGVQLNAVDIGIVVVQHVGGLAVRRQLNGPGAERVRQLAGLVQAVGFQVDQVQVVRVIGGHHVFVTGVERQVFIGQDTERTGAQDGESGQAASLGAKHAGILLCPVNCL
ncbi:hypothetical protein D3C84_794110 [compost metagenome]